MTPERHQRIKAIFLGACQRSAEGRGAFLSEACAGDAMLKGRVQSLLALDGDPAGLEPAAERIRVRLAKRPSSAPGCKESKAPISLDLIPGYTLIREIHRGGQGRVYEAIQKATHRRVALKVMREGPLAGPRARIRFEREIQILAQLRHPNIVAIHDSGQADGQAFFVMDYIGGQSLDHWISDFGLRITTHRKPNPQSAIDTCLKLFAKICEAVSAAHLRGVIHRDLKPANIRLDADGEPHILDFGLAKLVTNELSIEGASRPITLTGQFSGSLPWASPEQAEGSPGKIDTRTDVYSLGVILYQMLTGTFPYDVTGGIRDILDRIMRAEPRRPRSASFSINDEIETIVLKCLSKDRERRYQTAGELARDVRRYLAGEAIEAKRDSSLYVLRKQLRRHRAAVAVAAAFLIVVNAALGVSVMSWRRAAVGEAAARLSAADAERKYGIAREGADLFLHGICEELPKLAGSRELQRTLVEKAHRHYERLAEERPGDLDQRRGVWVSLSVLAETYRALGDVEQSNKTYEQVLKMAREARAARPDSAQFALDVATYCGERGWNAMNSGDLEKAGPYFAEERDIAQRLVDADPRNVEYQDTLAESHYQFGMLELWRQNHNEAAAHLRESMAITQRLCKAHPDNLEYQTNLSDQCLHLGDIARRVGDMKAAGDYFTRMAAIAEHLVAAEPNNPELQGRLARSLEGLGRVAFMSGDMDMAGRHYSKALAIDQRLTETDPKNPDYQNYLATVYARLGELGERTGELVRAEAYFQSSLAILERLTSRAPENPAYLDPMASNYECLARLADRRGNASESREYLVKQISARRRQAARPGATRYDLNSYAQVILTCDPAAALWR